MSSIRPLITITMLGIVAVILYVKINEGPPRYGAGADDAWKAAPPVGVPPLGTAASNDTSLFPPPATSVAPAPAASGTAPAWSSSAVSAATPPVADETTTPDASPLPATSADTGVSAVATPDTSSAAAAIPSIPPLPPAPSAGATSVAAPPVGLPANVPTAQYEGLPSVEAPPVASGAVSGRVPSLGTSTPDVTAGVAAPQTATNNPLAEVNQATPATTSAPAPLSAIVQPDRYGAASTASDESSFSVAWPVIQAALQRQELARAHLLLSQWYGDESLSPAEAQQVEQLLSQLAGTVVYSTEHRLEPAYVVRPGDTLDSIARQYGVPWQLLAKINGIPSVNQVQPGQQLKVVRGPFSAVVELAKGRMTLMLDGRYAGQFPLQVEPTAGVSEGQWLVGEKLATPSSTSRYSPASTSADRTLVLSSDEPTGQGATLTIASGSAVGPPPAIRVSPSDAEELSDILSVGSRILIRR